MNADRILYLTAARRHSATGTGRLIRQQAGLTMSEIARSIDTSLSVLSRWETGQRRPRGDAAVRWVELLNALERRRRLHHRRRRREAAESAETAA